MVPYKNPNISTKLGFLFWLYEFYQFDKYGILMEFYYPKYVFFDRSEAGICISRYTLGG